MDQVFNGFPAVAEEPKPEMESFGQYLQEHRKESQVSIEELSWATKIKPEYVYAMERGDFSALPGAIFTKGYIRSYSDYLGMDAQEALTRFAQCRKGECPGSPSPHETRVVKERSSWVSVFLGWLEYLKRLITGRDDFQVY